jgi:tetratricopeptide (TPR) repeat protein
VTAPSSGRTADRIPKVWGKVPMRNVHFTGRDALLKELHDQLAAQTTAVVSSRVVPRALQGLGGVGKTQVAIEYAYRYSADYDVVWWISADQESLIPGALAALAPGLEITSSISTSDTANAVLDALRRGQPHERWLLIFDSAGQPDGVRDYLLSEGPGHTIVTSRDPAWAAEVETIAVDVFTEEESWQFLSKRLPGIERHDSRELADALGFLPLALEQASATQATSGLSPTEYIKLLSTQAGRLLQEGRAAGYAVPVAAAWSVSVTQLKRENPEAVDLLRCCAFFGPGPIPRDVLTAGHGSIGTKLDAVLDDPIRLTQAIKGLGQYSLVQVNLGARTIQVHVLIQTTIREQLSRAEQEEFRHGAHLLLAAATPDDPDDAKNWSRFVDLLGHYGPARIVACQSREVRLAVCNVIRYLYMVGDFDAALRLATQASEEWTGDPATDVRDLLTVRRHRADTLRAIGRFGEASEINARAIADATAELGPEAAETLRAINSHGGDLRAAGHFTEAGDLDTGSVAAYSRAPDQNVKPALRAKNNLAVDLTLLGRYSEARSLLEVVYQADRAEYGSPSHPTVLLTLVNLTCATRLAGGYADAAMQAEDTYASCRANLGETSPITLFAATDLAVSLRLMLGGNARDRVSDLLSRHDELLGERSFDGLIARVATANAFRAAGDVQAATDLLSRAIDLYGDLVGPDHPFTLGCHGSMAVLRRLGGDAQAALVASTEAADRLAAALGPGHPWALGCAMGRASDLAALGRVAEASEVGTASRAGLTAALGPDHPLTLACTINLAADLIGRGEREPAELERTTAIADLRRLLGSDHVLVTAAEAGQRLEFEFDPPRI